MLSSCLYLLLTRPPISDFSYEANYYVTRCYQPQQAPFWGSTHTLQCRTSMVTPHSYPAIATYAHDAQRARRLSIKTRRHSTCVHIDGHICKPRAAPRLSVSPPATSPAASSSNQNRDMPWHVSHIFGFQPWSSAFGFRIALSCICVWLLLDSCWVLVVFGRNWDPSHMRHTTTNHHPSLRRFPFSPLCRFVAPFLRPLLERSLPPTYPFAMATKSAALTDPSESASKMLWTRASF